MNKQNSDIYCIGNGKVAGYFRAGNIVQMFGPCYSTPSVFSLSLKDENFKTLIERFPRSDVYTTNLCDQDGCFAKIEDFVHPSRPVFVRKVISSKRVEFVIESDFLLKRADSFSGIGLKSFLVRIEEGSTVFAKCKTDYEIFCNILFSEDIEIQDNTVVFPKGETYMFFVAGEGGKSNIHSFLNCMTLSKEVLSWDIDRIREERIQSWGQFFLTSSRYDKIVSKSSAKLQIVIENVIIALKTQTSEQGGVLAGMFYHLAYGRDMYGVIRGYLKLGFIEQAKKCIEFFINNYRKKGIIPNANGMGMDCSHCHENDEVEQTGYYLIEIADYYKETRDFEIIEKNLDYIEYLIKAQEKNISCNMLPFNGDETYIAGGLLPRSCIDHGSMEATALYIESVKQILEIVGSSSVFSSSWITVRTEIIKDVINNFCNNFVDINTVYTNNPYRLNGLNTLDYRHGVCHKCNCIDWIKRSKNGGYFCENCYNDEMSNEDLNRYSLDCAMFMPLYLNFSLLPEKTICKILGKSVKKFEDSNKEKSNLNTVGYELGLLLYILSKRKMVKEAEFVFDKLMSQINDQNVWVEYYCDNKPSERSCPYRPWESAINLTGIVEFLKNK